MCDMLPKSFKSLKREKNYIISIYLFLYELIYFKH